MDDPLTHRSEWQPPPNATGPAVDPNCLHTLAIRLPDNRWSGADAIQAAVRQRHESRVAGARRESTP
ncbi:hypothetical protein [Alloactinosynnema sp. L-07]|nr:hypothetical protein [Alloactinosynnema sp. L-07]